MKDEGACLVLEKYRMDFNSQLTPSCTFVIPSRNGKMDDLQESCQDLCSVFSLRKLLEPCEVCAVILLLEMRHQVLREGELPPRGFTL